MSDICNINITVNCSDKSIEIALNKLLEYDYFKNMLNFGRTKMSYEKIISEESDTKWTIYSFKLPHINVDCSSDVFRSLMSYRIDIYSFENSENILSIMIYIDMYQIPVDICLRGGFRADKHFYFVEYIKNKLPHMNPFKIISNGNFIFSSSFIRYGSELMSKNKLAANLIEDLTDCI